MCLDNWKCHAAGGSQLKNIIFLQTSLLIPTRQPRKTRPAPLYAFISWEAFCSWLVVTGEDSPLSASPEKSSNPSGITDSFYVIFFSPDFWSKGDTELRSCISHEKRSREEAFCAPSLSSPAGKRYKTQGNWGNYIAKSEHRGHAGCDFPNSLIPSVRNQSIIKHSISCMQIKRKENDCNKLLIIAKIHN